MRIIRYLDPKQQLKHGSLQPDGAALEISGDVLQDWNTDDMIFDVPRLIEFLSGGTTLPPGSVILTGTPHGVGFARKPPRWLVAGDVVTVSIEGIGALSNPVEEEPGA